MLQGRDLGDSRINVRPAQGAGTDDAQAMDCRCRVDGYANTSQRGVEWPGDETPATYRRGIVCAKLSAGFTFTREAPIAPGNTYYFYVICTWKWPHSISTNFSMQCAWLGAKNDNYITCKYYSRRYQTDKNNKLPWFFNRWRWFRRQYRLKPILK